MGVHEFWTGLWFLEPGAVLQLGGKEAWKGHSEYVFWESAIPFSTGAFLSSQDVSQSGYLHLLF